MADFRQGLVNVLIATCVAEEGIDVGEIDLIVCFDIATKNPTRFVQRIGRTGRKRDGKVLMLVTEGKEQNTLKDVLHHRDRTNQGIAHSPEIANVMQTSPRMIPSEFDPQCIETFIKIQGMVPLAKEQPTKVSATTSNAVNVDKIATKKNVKSKQCDALQVTQDVRKFFKPIILVAPSEEIENESLVYDDTMHYPDSTVSPSTTTAILTPTLTPCKARVQQNIKKLRTVKLQLLRTKPATSTKELFTNDVLKSAVAPKSLQKYALENNLPFLMSQMPNLSTPFAKNGSVTIEGLFGGATKLQSFVDASPKLYNQRIPLRDIIVSQTGRKKPPAVARVEKNFHKDESLVTSPPPTPVPEPDPLPDTQQPQFIETESRYHSYVESPVRKDFAASTPVIRSVKKRNPKRFKTPGQSPIKTAFQRVLNKQMTRLFDEEKHEFKDNFENTAYVLNKSKRETVSKSPGKLSEVLRFFRLTNVMEIFEDESTSENNNTDLYIGSLHDIFVSDDDEQCLDDKAPSIHKYDTKTVTTANSDISSKVTTENLINRTIKTSSFKKDISDLFAESFTTDEQGVIVVSSDSDLESVQFKPVVKCSLPSIPEYLSTDHLTESQRELNCTYEKKMCVAVGEPSSNSDDCIPASQPTAPLLGRSLSGKLAVLSNQLQRHPGAQPQRQISDDMFEVSTLTKVLTLPSRESNEISSSLKENVDTNSSDRKCNSEEGEKSSLLCPPMANPSNYVKQNKSDGISFDLYNKSEMSSPDKVPVSREKESATFSSPKSIKQPTLKGLDRSPSLLSSRISFSGLMNMAKARNTASMSITPIQNPSTDLSKFESRFVSASSSKEQPPVLNVSRNQRAKPLLETSSSDDDDFNETTKKKRSLHSAPKDISSSLKENDCTSPSRTNTAFASPRTSRQIPLQDITRSPSVLASVKSFSKIMSTAKAQSESFATKLNRSTINSNSKNIDLSRFERPLLPSQDHSPMKPLRKQINKRLIASSSSSSSDDDLNVRKNTSRPKKIRKTCNFIDDECDVSGAGSEDEECDDTILLADLIDDEEVHDTTSVNMQAIYLQSLRNPRPAGPSRRPLDVSYIYSQAVEPDVGDYREVIKDCLYNGMFCGFVALFSY